MSAMVENGTFVESCMMQLASLMFFFVNGRLALLFLDEIMDANLYADFPAVEQENFLICSPVDINSLPDEILEYILSLTSPYCDLKSALQVSKRWYNVTKG